MKTITTASLILVMLGTYPALAQDYGKVCPNSMTPQQAAAAGCRWVGAVGGYDICANPGAKHLPQCAIVNQPSPGGRPSDYQNPPENTECYALSVQVCHYVNDLHIAIPQGLRAQYYACVQKAQQHAKSPIRVQC
jgi:hypothetical protein